MSYYTKLVFRRIEQLYTFSLNLKKKKTVLYGPATNVHPTKNTTVILYKSVSLRNNARQNTFTNLVALFMENILNYIIVNYCAIRLLRYSITFYKVIYIFFFPRLIRDCPKNKTFCHANMQYY